MTEYTNFVVSWPQRKMTRLRKKQRHKQQTDLDVNFHFDIGHFLLIRCVSSFFLNINQ